MCNTNIPVDAPHTAQCVCVCVCREIRFIIAGCMPSDGKPYYTWREKWSKREQQTLIYTFQLTSFTESHNGHKLRLIDE